MADPFIQSFEIVSNGAVGDVLSICRKKNHPRLRVGVLPLTWFEWWPMFPESGMQKRIQIDADRFVELMQEQFGDMYELVIPQQHVDTLDKAYDAGNYFREKGVDVIVIDEATYVTDFIPIQAIDPLPHVPVILAVTQATSDLWDTMSNTDVIRFEGLVGTTQLAGAFAKIGRPYKVVVGSLEDNGIFEDLGLHLKILKLIHDLKITDIGIVGHTFRGMYDIEADKTKIKGVFGPNMLYLDVSHLIDIWEGLTEEETAAYTQLIRSELAYEYAGIDDEDIRKSASLGLAVRKLVKQFGIDGLTLLGQHYVEISTRASADLSFYCAEDARCMTTHEGDLANLVMKIILNRLSGDLPVFLEWSGFDTKSDTLFLTHHGVADPRILAADQKTCRVTPSPEKWDFTGNGFSVEYCARGGNVTLACLLDAKDGWKLLISSGMCVEMKQMPNYAPQFHFRHEHLHVRDFIKQIVEEGVSHHVCLIYGDYQEELKLYAEYIGLNTVQI